MARMAAPVGTTMPMISNAQQRRLPVGGLELSEDDATVLTRSMSPRMK